MQSTLNPKQSDDPHDFVVVAPDAIRVAPADDELSNVLHDAARHLSDSQIPTASGLAAGPPVPPVPPVDTTFRAVAVDAVEVPGRGGSTGGRTARAATALLLAACIGGAAIAWPSWGDAAKQIVANWVPQFIATSSLPLEKPDLSAPPAVQAGAANAAAPQPAPSAQSAAEAVAAPTPESEQLQSMSRDLASLGQEVVQLKASIEQLRASQQQMSRDVAKASEQNLRPRISAPPPRVAAAPARKPIAPYPPQAAATRALPQSIAPSAPPPPEPQATARPQADPELASVPRPPMPLR